MSNSAMKQIIMLIALLVLAFSLSAETVVSTPDDLAVLQSQIDALDARVQSLETDGAEPGGTTDTADPEPPVECDGIADCVEMMPVDDWKTAVQSVPNNGTLIVHPGTYQVDKVPWLSGRDSLTIIGLSDESGVKPHLIGHVNSFVPWRGTNGDLTVKNMHFEGGGDCIYAGSKARQQNILLEDVKLENCGHGLMGAFEYEKDIFAGVVDDRYTLKNVECSLSGTHCIYIDRAAYAEIDGGRFYSPGYHAIKVIARDVHIHDVTVSNVGLDGSLRDDGKIGAAPLSLIACQTGVIENNDIHFHYTASTGGTVIARQVRHDLRGCEIPPYPSDKFWSDDYWQSPDAFIASIRNNTITITGERGPGTELTVIAQNSTAPVQAIAPGSTKLIFLPRPDGWKERSNVIVENNTVTGMNQQDSLCLSKFWGQMIPDQGEPAPVLTEACNIR